MQELVGAIAIVLLGIAFYAAFLGRRQRRLARELELLESRG
jgi:CcmD family protein